ncbi:hypothetical protein [Aeromonas phage 44RR2.8t.2]|uniref:Uncharacterized protein n=1 Tax=Aeromonas phage 44RR2.8t.2 TaxID=1932900 RepID=A0A219Y9G7_9CAUD|nr:hypothetical protein [Aeromonas phage 44RR2.8t.2]
MLTDALYGGHFFVSKNVLLLPKTMLVCSQHQQGATYGRRIWT